MTGFSLLLALPKIRSGLLDFIAVRRDIRGAGTGTMLYDATREYVRQHNLLGIYMEALPDDPAVVQDPAALKENRERLRFYERYGIRPIIGTEYETPIGDSAAPYLLFDGLDRAQPLRRSECRAAVRAILSTKYSHLAKPDYIERVVESIVDDPVRFHSRVFKKNLSPGPRFAGSFDKIFVMVCSDAHQNHVVNDRVMWSVRLGGPSAICCWRRAFPACPKAFCR